MRILFKVEQDLCCFDANSVNCSQDILSDLLDEEYPTKFSGIILDCTNGKDHIVVVEKSKLVCEDWARKAFSEEKLDLTGVTVLYNPELEDLLGGVNCK